MFKKYFFIFVLAGFHLTVFAQLKVTGVVRLPLAKSGAWSNVQAADAKSVFFTTTDYQGIWQYTLSTRALKQIVSDPRSGFGFSVSQDGKSVAFRRTLHEGKARTQEVVVKNLATGKEQILAQGENLSVPSYSGATIVYMNESKVENLSTVSSKPVVLGIEDTRIVVLARGAKRLLDPMKGSMPASLPASYIWPVLSPNGKLVVASEMTLGTFVCDLKGNIVSRLGRRNGATWTRDGKWLVYMKDADDGHNITSSDLFCISPDGKQSAQLTSTQDRIELYPFCSPVENKIFCNTLDGDILVVTYAEVAK